AHSGGDPLPRLQSLLARVSRREDLAGLTTSAIKLMTKEALAGSATILAASASDSPNFSRNAGSADLITVRNRGRLPHWEKRDGIFFVTFHLVDSLPQSVLRKLEDEREDFIRLTREDGRSLTAIERKRWDHLYNERIQAHLDAGVGACYLAHPQIAETMATTLNYFDGNKYHLFAWCVMPNHVHVVLNLFP